MVETVKFDLGQLLITPGALDALTRNGTDEGPYLLRHQSGDWGDVDEIDKRENDFSLLERFRLMSAYHLNDQTKIWVITERDRNATTILLPEEFSAFSSTAARSYSSIMTPSAPGR